MHALLSVRHYYNNNTYLRTLDTLLMCVLCSTPFYCWMRIWIETNLKYFMLLIYVNFDWSSPMPCPSCCSASCSNNQQAYDCLLACCSDGISEHGNIRSTNTECYYILENNVSEIRKQDEKKWKNSPLYLQLSFEYRPQRKQMRMEKKYK